MSARDAIRARELAKRPKVVVHVSAKKVVKTITFEPEPVEPEPVVEPEPEPELEPDE